MDTVTIPFGVCQVGKDLGGFLLLMQDVTKTPRFYLFIACTKMHDYGVYRTFCQKEMKSCFGPNGKLQFLKHTQKNYMAHG